ncbi:MAG TPA: urocanate hydratase [Patescibacteria group bacterium]|nr:urocanate hydratase [Patescibacteria group bacterium]
MDKTTASDRPESRTLRAPRGAERSCRGWSQEAALRMLMNSLDPELAERPQDLVVCGASGRAARNWASFDAIVRWLRELGNDETLLVQSGKPAGVFRTHGWAPRVLIAGADGAGSWTYIGAQAILQETYEIFAAAGRKHFGGDLAGKLIVSGGMGRMGGAQALAATMNGASILCVEVDPERIKRWLKSGYCDVMVNSLDEALRILKNAVRKKEAASVGLAGNCADVIPELARRGVLPDLLTDQTGAHDPVDGYVPGGLTLDEAAELRRRDPQEYRRRAMESIARHVEGMLALGKLGSAVFEYGNGIRAMAREGGVKDACDFPSFAAYIRPLFCQGRGPLRWVALSGEPEDIRRIDHLALDMFGENNEAFSQWIRLAEDRVRFQGLPARAGWLGYGERREFGAAINDLVARGDLSAPVVIARDGFGAGSTTSPSRETEAMRDGSDAVADWPLLNALLNTASGASWVWVRSGGEAGSGQSPHSGYGIVADGTEKMGMRIERVLTGDSGIGIARLADAGYPEAVEFARGQGIQIPTDEPEGR